MKQLILFLLCLSTWTAQAKIYNVKDYGAKADGTTIDSPAINRAIEEAASQGGGTVYFPAGEYACYSIRLLKICLTSAKSITLSGYISFKECIVIV